MKALLLWVGIFTTVIIMNVYKEEPLPPNPNAHSQYNSLDEETEDHNAANPATAVGGAFTESQKHHLAKQSNLKKDALVKTYINRFKNTALREARLFNIPASIKLAQGIIESNAGQSKLALKEHNHFGIKCSQRKHNCKCATYADDTPKDKFRVFSSAWYSYREHSNILRKDRYKHLLKLDVHDYKSWAYGLQKAGYATNPNYAKLLISIIERYELYKIH